MYQSLQSTLSLTAMSDGLYAVNTHSILYETQVYPEKSPSR
jgi:hypothetical protein